MASRRQRTTMRGVTDYPKLLCAIKDAKANNKSSRKVAEKYGFPRSSMQAYINKFYEQVADYTVFDDEYLLDVVTKIASYGAPTQVSIIFSIVNFILVYFISFNVMFLCVFLGFHVRTRR